MTDGFPERDAARWPPTRRRVAGLAGVVAGVLYAFGVPVAAAVVESTRSGYPRFVFALVDIALRLLLLLPLLDTYARFRREYGLPGRASLFGLIASLAGTAAGRIVSLFAFDPAFALPLSVFTTTAGYALYLTASATGLTSARVSAVGVRTAALLGLAAPVYFGGVVLGLLGVLSPGLVVGWLTRLPLYLGFASLGYDLWRADPT